VFEANDNFEVTPKRRSQKQKMEELYDGAIWRRTRDRTYMLDA